MAEPTILYDKLSFWDDERRKEFEEEYAEDEVEYDPAFESDIAFDAMFDNKYANQLYVVCGIADHWDGEHKGYFDWTANSIKMAILKANNGYDGYITVSEGDYGRLLLRIGHHDGVNNFEVREVTKRGREMLDNYVDIGDILERQGTTRNVRYMKKYRL